MKKKKIVWITADYFADCDFIPISGVLAEFDIEWFVIHPKINPRYEMNDFLEFINKHKINLTFHLIYFNHRGRDPRIISDFYRLGKMALSAKADLYYVNIAPTPYLRGMIDMFPKNRVIITAHQGEIHKGFKHKWLYNISRKMIYGKYHNVNMFSNSQASLMKKNYPKCNITIIKLALKNYGCPTIKEASSSDKEILFLSFGVINYSKHIDLLIDAACNLYSQGIRGFKILIYGSCKNWEFYKKRIYYPKIFETAIRFINNEEIPNLFTRAHFFVQPYRIVTQSGAMKVAFQYNTPVIVSRLEGFTDELEEGINGYSFISEDPMDLEKVMLECIQTFKNKYDNLRRNMKEYTKNNYSPEIISKQYINLFNSTLSSLNK